MVKNIKNTNRHAWIFGAVSVTILIIYTITLVVPLIWVFLTSLKDPIEFELHPFGFNQEFVFDNYYNAFKESEVEVLLKTGQKAYVNVEGMLYNSVIYSIGCTLISTLTNCIVAYVVARYSHYKFTKFIYGFVIFTMVMPIVGSLPSEIQVAKALHFYNNLWGIFLMKVYFGGSAFLIFYSSFKSIPKDYVEAARIDGASEFKIMCKIMIPMARDTLITLLLIAFIGYWNDYYTPMIFLPSRPTIAYGIYRFQANTGTVSSTITVKLAACSILIGPILLIFLLLHKQIMKNITVGGIKG